MPVAKVKVWILKDGVYLDGVPRNKGEAVDIPEHLASDWLRAGLASESAPVAEEILLEPEAPKAKRPVGRPPTKREVEE